MFFSGDQSKTIQAQLMILHAETNVNYLVLASAAHLLKLELYRV